MYSLGCPYKICPSIFFHSLYLQVVILGAAVELAPAVFPSRKETAVVHGNEIKLNSLWKLVKTIITAVRVYSGCRLT